MKKTKVEIVGMILVMLMIFLQGGYGILAYIDPLYFSNVRGTELFSINDSDWVTIYGSRTLFIALFLGVLLYFRNYRVLMWCALLSIIMPVTDGILAYQAQVPLKVVMKHVLTTIYIIVTFFVLKKIVSKPN